MKNALLILINLYVTNLIAQHNVTIKTGDEKNYSFFTIQGDTTKNSFQATIAQYENRFEDAARFTIKGIEEGEFKNIANAYYDAACYFALTNNNTNAVKYLKMSIDNGWKDLAHLEFDTDLQTLKNSNEWANNINPKLKAYYKNNNKELAEMFANDQRARLSGQIDSNLAKDDAIRRQRVLELLEKNQLNSGHDFYKAAMIMHHGNSEDDYKLAEILIQKALVTRQIHHMAPWLSAAIKDRLLLKLSKPQWYGTQNMTVINGKIAIVPKIIDTTAVTPDRRKELNAPTIETLREYLKNFNSN